MEATPAALLAADILYLLAVATRARPAAAARKALRTFASLMSVRVAAIAIRLRAAGDERGQAIDVAAGVAVLDDRLRLVLRLRALMLAALFARLMLFAWLKLLLARRIRLLLLRDEAGLLSEVRVAVEIAVVAALARIARLIHARLLLVLILAELLLRSRDQTEIVFGVLIVVLGGNRIARRARIARELDILLGNMGGRAADLDIGAVRIEHPGHRVLAAPVIVIIIVVVIPVIPHPLVILTVSHVLPF